MPVIILLVIACSVAYFYKRKHQANQPTKTRREVLNIMDSYRETKRDKMRNLAAFWLLGLTNNFAYVIMLSAAHDILKEETNANGTDINGTTFENRSGNLVPDCNPMGTGVILLADILPALGVKLAAPFFIHLVPYMIKVSIVIMFGAASFPLVAASTTLWLSVSGVICASIASGLGEITFLSLSAHYDKNVVSTWSSGTGMAGVAGALSYAGLTTLGLSPRITLYIMLIVPCIMALVYFTLLTQPPSLEYGFRSVILQESEDEEDHLINHATSSHTEYMQAKEDDESPADDHDHMRHSDEDVERQEEGGHPSDPEEVGFLNRLQLKQHLLYIVPLLKYMIPLGLVYFSEYFINQALYELLTFQHSFLTIAEQYRWYQVIYQIGVLVSRSSVNCVHINKLWILPILQFMNLTFLLCQVLLQFVPSIWIIFFVILFEGLLGGAGYVNTFYKISKEVPEERREFSMGVASVSDSLGIAIAGFVSIPIHNFICTL